MEMELNTIIEKIKEEGVGEAEKKAAEIKEKAEKEARDILDSAESRKKEILKKAEQETAGMRKSAEEAVRQAARDLMLKLREEITVLFDRVLKTEIKSQLKPELLRDMILALVEQIRKKDSFDIEVFLGEEDSEKMKDLITGELKKKMSEGVTIKVSPRVENGFMIGQKDTGPYYDFTDEAIKDAFKVFLNPEVAAMLSGGKEKKEG